MAQQSNQVMNGPLCVGSECSPIKTAHYNKKCMICRGYYSELYGDDAVWLEDNGEHGVCHYCGNGDGVCQSKRTGRVGCLEGCDNMPYSEDEDENNNMNIE